MSRNEVVLDHASNWQIHALQTEEERGEGGFACRSIYAIRATSPSRTLHMYRVVSSSQLLSTPYAVKITNSTNIRFRNVHCYSDSKVSSSTMRVYVIATENIEVRQREFAWLTISGSVPKAQAEAGRLPILVEGAKVEKSHWRFVQYSPGEQSTAPETSISWTPNAANDLPRDHRDARAIVKGSR